MLYSLTSDYFSIGQLTGIKVQLVDENIVETLHIITIKKLFIVVAIKKLWPPTNRNHQPLYEVSHNRPHLLNHPISHLVFLLSYYIGKLTVVYHCHLKIN